MYVLFCYRNGGNDSTLTMSMNNLSFATLNVPDCKPSDGEEEIDKKSFIQWKELLEASMSLVGVSDEWIQIQIFKIKAGPKLLDVLNGTSTDTNDPDPKTEPYSNVMSRLHKYFGSRDYTLMQRQKLRSMFQEPNEPDMKYVKRVVAAAKLCDFEEDQLLENVCHIIQCHALNLKIREIGRKILRKGGSLINLLDKVRAQEVEKINEEIYSKNHQNVQKVDVAAVSFHHEQDRDQRFSKFHNKSNNHGQSSRGRGGFVRRGSSRFGNSRNSCWRCTSHYHSAMECHAMQKICHKCNKKGHIERACRNDTAMKRKNDDRDEATSAKVRKISTTPKDEMYENEKDDVVSD